MFKKLIIIVSIVFLGFTLASCEAPVFEVVSLPSSDYEYLSDYLITLNDVEMLDSFTYNDGESDIEIFAANGYHFIKLELTFNRKVVAEQSESTLIMLETFKLKDHDNIGSATNFSTIEGAISDSGSRDVSYSNIEPGSSMNIVMYFELPNDVSLTNASIYLEVDFVDGETGIDIPITQKI